MFIPLHYLLSSDVFNGSNYFSSIMKIKKGQVFVSDRSILQTNGTFFKNERCQKTRKFVEI
jgi:hypothetical protein